MSRCGTRLSRKWLKLKARDLSPSTCRLSRWAAPLPETRVRPPLFMSLEQAGAAGGQAQQQLGVPSRIAWKIATGIQLSLFDIVVTWFLWCSITQLGRRPCLVG